MSIDFEITTVAADEMPFIYDAWIKSFRVSPWAGCVRNDQFESVQRATIQGILSRGALIHVALAPRVEGVFTERRVMGFICTEPGLETLHYLYVKSDYRKHGIGKALLAAATGGWFTPRYSHRTRGSAILPKIWRWDPVVARVRSEEKPERLVVRG